MCKHTLDGVCASRSVVQTLLKTFWHHSGSTWTVQNTARTVTGRCGIHYHGAGNSAPLSIKLWTVQHSECQSSMGTGRHHALHVERSAAHSLLDELACNAIHSHLAGIPDATAAHKVAADCDGVPRHRLQRGPRLQQCMRSELPLLTS